MKRILTEILICIVIYILVMVINMIFYAAGIGGFDPTLIYWLFIIGVTVIQIVRVVSDDVKSNKK